MLLMASAASAQDSARPASLFTPCAEALQSPRFSSLRAMIPEGFADDAGCLRLNDREFVLLRDPSGPGNPFHYCDLRTSTPTCRPEPFAPYSFEVKAQFTSARGKQYLLWHSGGWTRGVYRDGFGIFSLVPKSIDPRGFAIYVLTGSEIFQGEDPSTADPCRDVGEEATEVTGYELSGEGTADLELRFKTRTIACKTKSESLELLRFRPKSGKFERVP